MQETNADRINNRLKNISEYDAYLQEINRRLVLLEPVPDKLLSFERSFEAKLKMASIMNPTELANLKNQLSQIQADLGNTLNELVIDESQIHRKSVDEIRQQIESDKAQKILEEQKTKEAEQQKKLNAIQSEKKKALFRNKWVN